ncbi:hypothetical protein A2851_02505 [Candidatus Kaiserbacteria bacterium RIFCSPHIGHO2_01_FULL_53_29]|uniref:UDP-glucose/GDP-mannose dehydrogenase C-terminal domain-containing protein n=1 Tax=Candidatus Kaiserbacteria bacterium RIFCSPHIGHO2_01_FULL_53_29 TaxID=1798480 RepID=A0A1F6CX45_9BACT|nr:MAG: hypothetical protein A2851_02505 [Candidatus Kaiserbacteria bacterium RIFCSPHIGHO2_01_FULL_53_29]
MTSKSPLIGFIGQGFIGKNYADDFERRGHPIVRYALEEPYRGNKEKIKDCDYVLIAVPTPTSPDGFNAGIVREAISLVGRGKTAVIKSTIVPGTTRTFQKEFPDRVVVYSPEFLSEVTAAHDAAHPFSNIVGLTDDSVSQKKIAEELHTLLPKAPFSLTCSSTEAEIIKYTHNGSGYTQIVFFNLMYELAKRHGSDWDAIQRAIEADPLVCNRYARPVHKSGRGAGGHCFIKDVAALRREYETKIKDTSGIAVLDAMEKKNIELLRSSGKDLDLLADVYGKQVLDHPIKKLAVEKLRSVRGEMKILVCTEAIDRTDPLLGFFHRWLEEFARHAHRVHVICLGYGAGSLPGNVIEHSLGKESARGFRVVKRILYTLRFLRYAWGARSDYDTVLVHLSPEYLIIAGFLWRMLGKRVGFWYNDASSNWRTRTAIALSDVLFYTNPDSYAAKFAHARKIPMGIDTDMYAVDEPHRASGSLLFLGRISPAKHLDVVLGALSEMDKPPTLDIYGRPGPGNDQYASQLRTQFAELERRGTVTYRGSILHDRTPEVYAAHDIFIHIGSLRGFNKTLLEAMAGGNIVITTDPSMRGVVHDRFFMEKLTKETVSAAIMSARALSAEDREQERSQLSAYVRREHSLSSVVPAMLEMLARPGGEQR